MTDAPELKPCPFCGGEADLERRGDRHVSTIVACLECGCRLENGETFDHGSAWNTRDLTPSAPTPVVPKVKPLFWENNGATYPHHRAGTDMANYSIDTSAMVSMGRYPLHINGLWTGKKYQTLAQAKAAAQADHEARILSQIDMAPVTVPAAARVILKDTDALTELSVLTMKEHKRTLNTGKGGYLPALKHALSALAEQEGSDA